MTYSHSFRWLVALSVAAMVTSIASARGIRGGGGGGVSRSMPSRPSPSMNRSPSMSRGPSINRSPTVNRSYSSQGRPSTAVRPGGSTNNRSSAQFQGSRTPSGVTRPGTNVRPGGGVANSRPGTASRPGTSARPGTGSFGNAGANLQNQRSYQRPSSNQLQSFLDIPKGAASSSGSGNTRSRSYETKGGSTVTVGGARGSGTTDGGVNYGGAGRGVVVQGANGQTYARGSGVAGAGDGTNRAVAGGSRTGLRTANGETAVAGRGIRAATDGRNSIVRGGAAGAVQDRNGNTRAGAVGGTRATDGNNVYRSGGSVRAIRDPAGNVLATGQRVATYNGAVISQRQAVAVRSRFTGYGYYYTPNWYRRYPGAWYAAGIATTAWWTGAYWNSASGYCGCEGEPVSYDYGDTIIYQDDVVYAGDQPIASADEYYEQATEIAEAGKEKATNEDWLPLGVFALVSEGQTSSDKIIQLAVNKQGIIRGNLHDRLTDSVIEIVGSVDKETQRAAFQPADKELPIAECGLYNLTQNAVTLLVHFDAERSEQRSLIRLEQPEEN
jgi:hypothetical protein